MGDSWFRPSLWASVLVMSVFAFGVAGCGGSDDESSSGGDTTTTTAESDSTEADTGTTDSETTAPDSDPSATSATLPEALTCLQEEGIDAKDQTSNTSGETIGIDYSGGRTTISFEESPDDAEITAMVAEDYGQVIQVGSVVVAIDPSADSADTEFIRACITN